MTPPSGPGWQVVVRGIPGPQGSKDQFGRESSRKVKPWREAVRHEVADAIDGGFAPVVGWPVLVRIDFYLPRPKAHYRTGKNAHLLRDGAPDWVSKRPDLDKLARSTLDALTAAGAYPDDACVAHLEVTKQYGGIVGATIFVGPVSAPVTWRP